MAAGRRLRGVSLPYHQDYPECTSPPSPPRHQHPPTPRPLTVSMPPLCEAPAPTLPTASSPTPEASVADGIRGAGGSPIGRAWSVLPLAGWQLLRASAQAAAPPRRPPPAAVAARAHGVLARVLAAPAAAPAQHCLNPVEENLRVSVTWCPCKHLHTPRHGTIDATLSRLFDLALCPYIRWIPSPRRRGAARKLPPPAGAMPPPRPTAVCRTQREHGGLAAAGRRPGARRGAWRAAAATRGRR